MFYRVDRFTIHLQPGNGRGARRAWERGQSFISPKRYMLQSKNVIPMQNSRRKMDLESDFKLGFRV